MRTLLYFPRFFHRTLSKQNGAMEIVGRRKASFKLAQGEYVSPDKVEAMLQLCPLVDQVYVDGISVYTFAVAIVVPNFSKLRQFLTDMSCGYPTTNDRSKHPKTCSDAELCSDPYVRELLLEELSKTGRANGLKGFELVSSFSLLQCANDMLLFFYCCSNYTDATRVCDMDLCTSLHLRPVSCRDPFQFHHNSSMARSTAFNLESCRRCRDTHAYPPTDGLSDFPPSCYQ